MKWLRLAALSLSFFLSSGCSTQLYCDQGRQPRLEIKDIPGKAYPAGQVNGYCGSELKESWDCEDAFLDCVSVPPYASCKNGGTEKKLKVIDPDGYKCGGAK